MKEPTWPLRPVVGRAELGALGEAISENTGQSLAIRPLTDHPGWLAKLYKQPRPQQESERLDGLIAAPATLGDSDRRLLRSASSWPVARIAEPGNPAVGCVIPVAPPRFRADLTVGSTTVLRYIEVDWLAKTDAAMAKVGIAAQGDAGRITACRNLAALAEVLEKLGLVYSDWSYSNAFWSPADRSVFVIDIDGCQAGKMPNVQQPGWADPLTPLNGDADGYTDRFRFALLIARCLTATRRADDAIGAIAARSPAEPAVRDVLLDMLLAADRERRPSIGQLRLALSGGPYFRPQPKPAWLTVPGVPDPASPDRQRKQADPEKRKWTPVPPVPEEPSPAPVASPKPKSPSRIRTAVSAVLPVLFLVALIVALVLLNSKH